MTLQSDTMSLKSVLMKAPEDAFVDQEHINSQWRELNYLEPPDFERACQQHEKLRDILSEYEVETLLLPRDQTTLDSLYCRDATISTRKGLILCNMGKPERGDEPTAQGNFLRAKGFEIKGEIVEGGRLEGGDVIWLDDQTLAVARGYRTNDEGIEQLKLLVADVCEEVIVFHSPHFRGPSDVFHLMSVYSPLDDDLAVVYSPLMPVSFRDRLVQRGMRLIEVPEKEYDSLGCNVLAIAPKVALIAEGNPETVSLMKKAGVDVREYSGNEISLKGSGGPTCLTRPLLRQ